SLYHCNQLEILNLTESRAIARYVARKYKSSGPDLLREGDLQESAVVDQWMEVEAHQYNPAMSPIVFQLFVIPMRGGVPDQQVIDNSLVELEKVLDIYEDRLSKSKYLAGDFFSPADLNHLPLTHYFMTTPYKSLFKSCPHLNGWWEDWSSRPAVKKVTDAMDYAVIPGCKS
uniref:glutathione transferase n=1 Tax=Elaeis guineensis var. tenera TaxID=51953 RepID=A0A6J0PA58_ELAGV